MRFFINLIKQITKDPPKILGRWRLDSCNEKLNFKVDLSNEDHCGPCGQYVLEKSKDVKPVSKIEKD